MLCAKSRPVMYPCVNGHPHMMRALQLNSNPANCCIRWWHQRSSFERRLCPHCVKVGVRTVHQHEFREDNVAVQVLAHLAVSSNSRRSISACKP